MFRSGAAMAAMEQLLREMPPGIGYEWSGRSYQERLSGDQAPLLYAVSVLFIFLCLGDRCFADTTARWCAEEHSSWKMMSLGE